MQTKNLSLFRDCLQISVKIGKWLIDYYSIKNAIGSLETFLQTSIFVKWTGGVIFKATNRVYDDVIFDQSFTDFRRNL